MPVYEYRCEFCASRLEVERSFDSEAGSPTCRDCGVLMSRVWHSPQIKFNGPGFYSTDN